MNSPNLIGGNIGGKKTSKVIGGNIVGNNNNVTHIYTASNVTSNSIYVSGFLCPKHMLLNDSMCIICMLHTDLSDI